MTAERGRVRAGMDVVGPDGGYIGNVAGIDNDQIVVNRPETSTVYIPLDVVTGTGDDHVSLNVSASDVDLQNWPHEGGFVGAVSTRSGPEGPGMPSGQPGWPTFEGTDQAYGPGPGASNLVDEPEPGHLAPRAPHLPGTGNTGAGDLSGENLQPDADQPHVDLEDRQGP